MIHFVSAYLRAQYRAGLVLAFFCLLAVSCDFSQGLGDERGSLTITLPGARMPERNLAAARSIHLPEEITGQMEYKLAFYGPGNKNFFVGPIVEKMITVGLEPGWWEVSAIAMYGSDMAAVDEDNVNIQAGRENSVTFTMEADNFVTPDRDGWVDQDKYVGAGDPPPSLSATMNTSTPFSSISGWTDSFLYAWYYEDAGGTRTDVTAADNFSGPGTVNFTCTVNNSTVGTFFYICGNLQYLYLHSSGRRSANNRYGEEKYLCGEGRGCQRYKLLGR
jgi:hypothetical protein